MTIDLMTAKEANKIYQDTQEEKAKKIISNIVDNIKEAIAAGAGSADMTFNDYIYEHSLITTALTRIQGLGYKVNIYPYVDNICRIIVSWENIENG